MKIKSNRQKDTQRKKERTGLPKCRKRETGRNRYIARRGEERRERERERERENK